MKTVVILIAVIVLFQIVYGSIALKGIARLSFQALSIISIVLICIISIAGFWYISNDLRDKQIMCGMPLVAYLMLIALSFIFLLFIIGLQLIIRYYSNSNPEDSRRKRHY